MARPRAAKGSLLLAGSARCSPRRQRSPRRLVRPSAAALQPRGPAWRTAARRGAARPPSRPPLSPSASWG
eukprot:6144828-Pyramimonas_sp.AAC.1